jgi:hypothetical protein
MFKRQKTENLAGAGKNPALRVAFDSRLKLEFHGANVTSDAGLLAYRELDAALDVEAVPLTAGWRRWRFRESCSGPFSKGLGG